MILSWDEGCPNDHIYMYNYNAISCLIFVNTGFQKDAMLQEAKSFRIWGNLFGEVWFLTGSTKGGRQSYCKKDVIFWSFSITHMHSYKWWEFLSLQEGCNSLTLWEACNDTHTWQEMLLLWLMWWRINIRCPCTCACSEENRSLFGTVVTQVAKSCVMYWQICSWTVHGWSNS